MRLQGSLGWLLSSLKSTHYNPRRTHDGADDVLFCNPDFYCVADGKSGNLRVGPVELQPLLKWWAAYASPALLERAGAEPVV